MAMVRLPKQPTPPRLLATILIDFIFAGIWIFAGIAGIKNGNPILGGVFVVSAIGLLTVGFLSLTRNQVLLIVALVTHGLLLVFVLINLTYTFLHPSPMPPGVTSGSFQAGQVAGFFLVVLMPIICMVQLYQNLQFKRKALKAAAGPAGDPDDEYGDGPSNWDRAKPE